MGFFLLYYSYSIQLRQPKLKYFKVYDRPIMR